MGKFVLPVAVAVLTTLSALAWPYSGWSLMENLSTDTADRAVAAARRVGPRLERDLAALGLAPGVPVFLRVFKRESVLELWVEARDGRYRRFRTYPICAWSGELGPKQREGDRQAPEGFYRITPGLLNPRSRFHLAMNLGYPNAYDRGHGRSGDFLMVHGSCVSIGCYAMGDAAIEEIYTLVAAALARGQSAVEVHAFPFRLDAAALASEAGSPWHGFWSELKAGYDAFERSARPPRIEVVGGHYRVGTR